jgi:Na+/alanine symporter
MLLFFVFAFSGIMISFVYSELSVTFYKEYADMEVEVLNKLTFVTSMIEGCG